MMDHRRRSGNRIRRETEEGMLKWEAYERVSFRGRYLSCAALEQDFEL